MSHQLPTLDQFWMDPSLPPTTEVWTAWKTTFTDYLSMLPVFDKSLKLSEDHALKLLRLNLGVEGRRVFDSLNLRNMPNLKECFKTLDRHWGKHINTYVSRYKFSQLKQAAGESLDRFISRIICSVRSCDYNSIVHNKFEEVLMIQQLITGVTDPRVRESLLMEPADELTWELACNLARVKVDVQEQNKLFQNDNLQSQIARVEPRQREYNTSVHRRCYRCGSNQHLANSKLCQAVKVTCRACGKLGHLARVCRARTVSHVEHDNDNKILNVAAENHVIFALSQRNIPVTQVMDEPKLPTADVRTVYFQSGSVTTRLAMELDSASPVTIIPYQFYEQYFSFLPVRPSSYVFNCYSNNIVQILGFIIVTLSLNESHKCDVAVYISSNNSKPLLGRNAMVSLKVSPCINRMSISSLDTQRLENLYPNLFRSGIGRIPRASHRIRLKTDYAPFSISQPRPVPLAKKAALSQAIEQMVRDDLIEQIPCSEWVHPLVAVQKKDGSIRVCTDLRMLNKHVIVDKFPLPSADEMIPKLSGAKVFSKLDIRSAYFHMPLTEDSRHLTAFLTQDGLFQYKVLPMGLSSAPAAWQKFITLSLADVKGCVAYMDDICVFGSSPEEHHENLHSVLKRLNDLNLRLNMKKCRFGVTEIEFLGHVISSAGLTPNIENTKAILECPRPNSVIQVKHFLGLCSYYLRHLPDFATVSEPLRRITRLNEDFVWSAEQENAYSEIQKLVASTPTVAIFDESCPTFVSTDASDVGLGAVLSQLQNGVEKVVAYASRTLSDTERRYSTGEKEALACVWACEKWHVYLFGRRFVLRTDHSALTSLLGRGCKGQKPLRISRWYSRLLNYDFDLIYIQGKHNQVADALSRLPLANDGENEDLDEVKIISSLTNTGNSAITFKILRDHTQDDPNLLKLCEYITNSWPPRNKIPAALLPFFSIRDELTVVDSCILRGNRFVIPESLIAMVLECAHEGHPGIVRTKARIREYYWWPKLNSSVETAVRDCYICQHSDKSAKPLASPIQPIEYPLKPWAKIAIDIMGPFHKAPWHKRNILVATCFYSKWPEATACGEVTTSTIIKWLRYLFARFGLPEEIVSDNGPQFRSNEFAEFLNQNGIKHSKTVPYNPSANGMVERLNRTLKESIQAIELSGEAWEDSLIMALGTYRTTPHSATSKTPAELMFGRRVRTRLNAAFTLPEKTDYLERARLQKYQQKYRRPGQYCPPGTLVRVRAPQTRKGGNILGPPTPVIARCSQGTYRLSDGSKVNARRLYTTSQSNTLHQPLQTHTSFTPTSTDQDRRRSTRLRKPVQRYGFDF